MSKLLLVSDLKKAHRSNKLIQDCTVKETVKFGFQMKGLF